MRFPVFVTFASWAALNVNAHAGGFALEQQNAAAVGNAYAGAEAEFGDAGYAYYNPAAIADLEAVQFSLNAAGIFADSSYENASGLLLGAFPTPGLANDGGAVSNALVPNISAALPVSGDVTIGVVLNAPFGLKTEYDDNSVIRYHALETDIKTLSIAPTIAINLSPDISVGGSLRVQYLDFEASNAVDAAGILLANGGSGTPGTDDAQAAFSATDWALGFQVGVQAKIGDRTKVGISYASKVEHDFSGVANFDLSSSLSAQALNVTANLFSTSNFDSALTTPGRIAAGGTYEVSNALKLKMSVVHTFWENFDGVFATFDNPAQPPESLTQDWQNSWTVSLGADIAAGENTILRAGVMYDETPVNPTFASPRIPDENRYWINAGLSQKVSKNISVDIGAGYAFLDDRAITQSPAAAENLFRGGLDAQYETNAFVGSLRIVYTR